MRRYPSRRQNVISVRLAVLAALNIADEYHLLSGEGDALPDVRRRTIKLASALGRSFTRYPAAR